MSSARPSDPAAALAPLMDRRRKSHRPRAAHQTSAEHDHLQMLTTGACARWMGVTTSYVVAEIREGFLVANNVGKMGHRHDYRIYFPFFVAYLRARRWSRIPIDPKELS